MIGITGNAGSGKSEVAQLFRRAGAYVISADRLGWELLERKDLKAKILSFFGDEILNQKKEIDRKILGKLVFAKRRYRLFLNRTIHPALQRKITEVLRSLKRRLIVIDAALLLNWRIRRLCDLIVWVSAPQDLKIKNLMRKGFLKKMARQILETQLTEQVGRSRADLILYNESSLSALQAKARAIIRGLK